MTSFELTDYVTKYFEIVTATPFKLNNSNKIDKYYWKNRKSRISLRKNRRARSVLFGSDM